jgi:hypothetical protein
MNANVNAPVNVNAPPPTKGPPTMMIVGGVVLLLVIIIIVVLFTRPSPEPAPAPAPAPAPTPVAPVPPPPKPAVPQSQKGASVTPALTPVVPPTTMSPAPVAGKTAIVSPSDFDAECLGYWLKTMEPDFPYVKEYVDYLKSTGAKTTPFGGQCPKGTTADAKAPPGQKCQFCAPSGPMPPPPGELQKKIQAWAEQRNKELVEKKKQQEDTALKNVPTPAGKQEIDKSMPEAKFFTDCNFQGDMLSLRTAKIPDLASINGGQFARKISSIQVPKDLKVAAFKGGNFTGANLGVRGGQIECLLDLKDGDTNWNDSISSLIVEEVK